MPGVILQPDVPDTSTSNFTTLSQSSAGKLQISVGGATPVDVGGGSGTVHVTAPITGDGSVGAPLAVSPATDSTPGSLSAADKTKLDGLTGTVHTDTTMTGDGSVGTPLSVVPQFGSDTLVKLPNSATVQKTVLELVTSYTSNTSGAEASKWVVELLSGGVQVTALDLRPTQVLMASASAGAPAFAFQADPASGMYYQGGTVWLSAQGTPKLGVTNGAVFTTSGSPLYINTDFARGIGQVGSNVYLFSGADIQMGADGALATTATLGFLTIPTCAGAPTGVATPRSGHIALVFDTTNSKLWSSTGGGTWKGVVLA